MIGPEGTVIPGSEDSLARGRPGSLDSVQMFSILAAERGGRHPREKGKNCPRTAEDRFSHGWGWDPIYLGMGWGVVFCYAEIARVVSHRSLAPVIVGGRSYSVVGDPEST